MKKTSFTMSEALIVLGIVAILASLSVIALNNAKPDESIIMYRRAYSNTLKVIQNLMNDSQLYPNAAVISYSFSSNSNASSNSIFLSPVFVNSLGAYETKSYPYYPNRYNQTAADKACEGATGYAEERIPYICNGQNHTYYCVNRGIYSSYNEGGVAVCVTCSTFGCDRDPANGECRSGCIVCNPGYKLQGSSCNAAAPCLTKTCTSAPPNGKCTNNCIVCDSGYVYTGASIFESSCGKITCPESQVWVSSLNKCVEKCNESQQWVTNKGCVSKCSSGQTWNSTKKACEDITCPSGQHLNASKTACEKDKEPDTPVVVTPPDHGYNFSELASSVFGKGFADTEITASMRTKYPYLASATPNNKFAYSFMYSLNPISSSVSGNTATFSTSDGIYWIVNDHFNDSGAKYATITVYVDGANKVSSSCVYNKDSCKLPNKFIFYIETSGKAYNRLSTNASETKADPMACSYSRYSSVKKQSQIKTSASQNSCFAGQ